MFNTLRTARTMSEGCCRQGIQNNFDCPGFCNVCQHHTAHRNVWHLTSIAMRPPRLGLSPHPRPRLSITLTTELLRRGPAPKNESVSSCVVQWHFSSLHPSLITSCSNYHTLHPLATSKAEFVLCIQNLTLLRYSEIAHLISSATR